MKSRFILPLICITLLIVSIGCAIPTSDPISVLSSGSPFPVTGEPSAEPSAEKDAFVVKLTSEFSELTMSIDDDPEAEILSVNEYEDEEGYHYWSLVVKDQGVSYAFDAEGSCFVSLCVSDLCTDNMYLFFTIDYASADFNTYCLTYQNGHFETLSFKKGDSETPSFYGEVAAIEKDGSLILRSFEDFFGTWICERKYRLSNDLISPTEEKETILNSSPLTTACSIPATLITDGTERTITLEAGTNLYPTHLEGTNTFYFTLEDGQEGYLLASRENYEWYIDGISEYTCFTEVNYAG